MAANLLVTYYGDDFTGSTDVMEVLSLAGIRTVLFFEPPSADDLCRFGNPQAAGVAGDARGMTPAEMDDTLPSVFRALRDLDAPFVHYKVCSTFDSSPAIGSIGRAIDLGQRILDSHIVPLVVGAPRLGRYCVFGNLFARSGLESPAYRLDRHPTMRHHPITPMRESDLRAILAEQTARSVVLVDVLTLDAPSAQAQRRIDEVIRHAPAGTVVLFDTLCEAHLPAIGEFLCRQPTARAPLFMAGSSGIEYALTAHWRREGCLRNTAERATVEPVDQLLIVSGSCSPVADAQIAVALEQGFAEVPVAAVDLLELQKAPLARAAAVERAGAALAKGRSVILHTCRGSEDPRRAAAEAWRRDHGVDARTVARTLGEGLGGMLKGILETRRVPRVVVVGGDTSTFAVRALGAAALEMWAPLAPGSPVCRLRDSGARLDGLQIVLKGGQTGHRDFFTQALHGGVAT